MDQLLTIAASGVQPPASSGDADVRLVDAARAGDGVAFDELYRRYRRLVHGVLLSRVPPADAEDLVQEVFLQAWRQVHGLRSSAAFGGWLIAMARHRAIDHLRARVHVEPLDDTPGGPLADPRHAASAEDDVRAAQALAAIQALPEAYRETLLLRLVEGMTGPEIARQTGLTPGSVRVNLCRGMKLLRERLAGGDSHVG